MMSEKLFALDFSKWNENILWVKEVMKLLKDE